MKNTALKITMFFCIAIFSTQGFAKDGQIKLTNKVFKQVITTNKKGEKKLDYVKPALAIPGDIIYYVTTFENISQESAEDIVIKNPIPNNSKYRASSAQGKDTKIDFSIDKGKTFGAPDKLIVTDKTGKKWKARPEDYTGIRWIYTKPLAPGEIGTVTFKTKIKK